MDNITYWRRRSSNDGFLVILAGLLFLAAAIVGPNSLLNSPGRSAASAPSTGAATTVSFVTTAPAR
ncbi:MAG TPA: hypothetical protein VMU33_06195 [Burkholderiaceae bacterium]|nr:hypothetical protein [Burkholderiaceae bacterium]